ncbi:hypothetical protein PoB_001231900 [Plakobranchus ocellatus]|uniref:Uncharacterized protein n=1 Tax=Plakobranchus ocellatus TaxID=259542 RepID=A0AAV3YRW8_9GAST|nr:hypothetical protein PoB_001231900 [Plakobranchus ocellatus]
MNKEGSPQQGDLRLSGPLSGQSACAGSRTRDRRVPVELFLTLSSRRPTGVPNLLQKGLFGFYERFAEITVPWTSAKLKLHKHQSLSVGLP